MTLTVAPGVIAAGRLATLMILGATAAWAEAPAMAMITDAAMSAEASLRNKITLRISLRTKPIYRDYGNRVNP